VRVKSEHFGFPAVSPRALLFSVDLLLHRGPRDPRGEQCTCRGDQTCSLAFVDVQHAAEPSRECPMAGGRATRFGERQYQIDEHRG
jgi:hypothetical protein